MTDRSKRPSFQWYPGDAMRDAALRACCLEARGLWREMLDWMHDGEPYGYLTAGGIPIGDGQLAGMVGITPRRCTILLVELESRSVFSRTEAGVIYSRRMVRDGLSYIEWSAKSKRGGEASANQRAAKAQPPPSPNGQPLGNTALASALADTSPPSAREELLRLVPNRRAWELEFAAALDGMHGPQATDAQIDLACREYLGNGAAGKPNLPHWRGHLRRVVEPPAAMPTVQEGPDAGGYVQRIRELIRQIPGRSSYLPKTEVAAMGADVLRAYEAVGGADRFLALTPKDLPFLIRDFRQELIRANASTARDLAVPKGDRE